MGYLVFDTEAEALAREAAISADLGLPAIGINAATGEPDPEVVTSRWAVPQQRLDGRWVFPSPNEDEGEALQPDWFQATDTVV